MTADGDFPECPCGHSLDWDGTPGFYMCIGGTIYGPCDYADCGGICEGVADCAKRPGCCEDQP